MKYSTVQFFTDFLMRLTLGKVQKKISLYDLKRENYASLNTPVFVLSTGRCRTHWLTNIIAEQKNVFVQHSPAISFLEEGKLIYETQNELTQTQVLLNQLVCTARDHLWLDCAKRNLRYIETNNRISFAVPQLKNLISHSRFLHLTRHPISFIRSGRNRNWYEGNSHDLGRIVMQNREEWNALNLNQKIGWLWLETNRYIVKHTENLITSRIFRVASEDLDFSKMEEVFGFMKLDPGQISRSWFGKITNTQHDHLGLLDTEIREDLEATSFYKDLNQLATQSGYIL